MPGYAWIAEVRPGMEAEYKRRHDAIWPELVHSIRMAGMRHYHIFRNGSDLIGTFETDDLDRALAHLTTAEVNKRWSAHMAPVMIARKDPATGYLPLLERQWSLEP